MTSNFQKGKRRLTDAQIDKKERKVNRRKAKLALAKSIVRSARAQGIPSLASPGAARKLVDRLIKQNVAQIRVNSAKEMAAVKAIETNVTGDNGLPAEAFHE